MAAHNTNDNNNIHPDCTKLLLHAVRTELHVPDEQQSDVPHRSIRL